MPLRWAKPKDVPRPTGVTAQRPTGPVRGEPIVRTPSHENPVKGCIVEAKVKGKRFTLTPVTGSNCAEELEKTKELGTENRDYFLSHFKTADPELSKTINALRKKKS